MHSILVVEDEQPLLNAVKTKLEKQGHHVLTACTKKEAVHALEHEAPVDALWLDHYLVGKESGLDLLTAIRTKAAWKHIPVFVVSNTASHDKQTAYAQLGVVKYFVKAENRLDEIIQDVEKYLDGHPTNNSDR